MNYKRCYLKIAVAFLLISVSLTGCSSDDSDRTASRPSLTLELPYANEAISPDPVFDNSGYGVSVGDFPEAPSFEEPPSEEPPSEEPPSEEPSSEEPPSEEPPSEEPPSEEPPSEEPSSEEPPSEEPPITDIFDGSSGESVLHGGVRPFIHYCQTDALYKQQSYGSNTIGSHGCGPTNMAMILSTLTQTVIRPDTLADWAVENGYYVKNVGTSHAFMAAISSKYGVKVTNVYSMDAVMEALRDGKYAMTVVTKGDFSYGAHFLTLRGVTDDGKLLVADSLSLERSVEEWTVSRIKNQLRSVSFWVFEK